MGPESLTSTLIAYRYWMLIPLSLLEGPTVAFITGTLAARGYFNPYVVYGIFILKDAAVDSVYYFLGRFGGVTPLGIKALRTARVTSQDLQHVRTLWHRHGWRTMCVGKLAWGLSPVVLTVAGIVAFPFATYLSYAVGVALAQYAVLLALGYYFGQAIGTLSTTLRVIQYLLAAAVLGAIVYLRRRLRLSAR
jgi:membrane protein DedA with SNARE-associated domain